MVGVPAGEFIMGSPAGEGADDEHPQHTVSLDAFWIDRTEVTNAQYRGCLDAGACAKPQYWGDSAYDADGQPVVGVVWNDAEAYCKWAGARLPTEAEWEKAARGTDGRVYPWGNEDPTCERANYNTDCVGKPALTGSYPASASPYGALDMAGNVWEWVADWYAADTYGPSPQQNPTGPDSGDRRVLRGGSWNMGPVHARCAYRDGNVPGSRFNYLGDGFRCSVSSTSSP
jgi:formylglycine-generating enzyme required for sulfatase activity